MKWINQPETDIPYFTFEKLAEAGFPVNAFTTKLYRKDGKENDFFQLLLRSDSVPSEVEYCKALLLKQFGIDAQHLVRSAQKHTANIHIVTEADLGPECQRQKLEYIDGLVTNIPGVMLQTFGADCPTIYLADPQSRAIGLCHSGRNGTQNHIGAVMLRTMAGQFGTRPENVIAAISPGICVSCYEVGTDVAADFVRDYYGQIGQTEESCMEELLKKGLRDRVLQFINGRYHIDLFRSVTLSLLSAGIKADQIEASDICTKCRSDILFSFRAEGRISNENSAVFMA